MLMDGYSRRVTIGKLHVIYRPAVPDERRMIRRYMSNATDDIAMMMASWWMASKIEFWSSGNCTIEVIRDLWGSNWDAASKLFLVIQGLVADDSGKVWKEVDIEFRKNLIEGANLQVKFPKIANRSCNHCKTYWYNEKTGKPHVVNSTGLPLLRDSNQLTLCNTEEGCPKGTPENQRSLCIENKWALEHYRGCVAAGAAPDDEIVKRNARILRKLIG